MGRRRRGEKGDDGDNDNGERLLTKIEVVVMTGIARDEALRGDALVDALSQVPIKKTEHERERERVREERGGGGGGGPKEREKSRGESAGTEKEDGGHAEENR